MKNTVTKCSETPEEVSECERELKLVVNSNKALVEVSHNDSFINISGVIGSHNMFYNTQFLVIKHFSTYINKPNKTY